MQEAEPNDASMLIPMNFTTLTSCWFNLRENTSSNKGSNSIKWSLTEDKRQSGPITTGAPLPSTTTTTSLPSSSSPAASATASASASASAGASVSSNDDLSTSAKAGLGIGVGIGTALLCAGAFWLYYRHVKKKEHHQEVYRRIVGGQGGAAASGQDAFTTPSEHLEPWRYGSTPQPAPSAVGSAYSGASDHSSDWYSSQATVTAPYQYYDPVGSSHHVPAVHHPHPPPLSVLTTASMTAEPPSSIIRDLNTPRAEHVPEAAAIRDVQDLNSSLYPSEYNEPVSPVSADRDVPPPRSSSVNYGPMGRLDASTGADFTLLPDYTSPTGGGAQREDDDDLYGPPTPRSPPPPHSAHAHIANEHLPQQQQHQQPHVTQEHAWQSSPHSASPNVVELPTAQTHHGYGPRAELPAGDGVHPALRQQPSDLQGPEQKFLLQDIAPLRTEQRRDGG